MIWKSKNAFAFFFFFENRTLTTKNCSNVPISFRDSNYENCSNVPVRFCAANLLETGVKVQPIILRHFSLQW